VLDGHFLNYLSRTNPFCQCLWYFILTYPFGARRSVAKNIRRKERNGARSVLRNTDIILFQKEEKVTGIH